MKLIKQVSVLLVVMFALGACTEISSTDSTEGYPKLILQKKDIGAIKEGLNQYDLLSTSLSNAITSAENGIKSGVEVPFPKDPGGGYTHEKHKKNYIEMYHAGLAYQLTDEVKYADFVKEMLNAYAELYPTLGLHPMQKNQSPGKLFWQGLNESVWLVYTIQAYDCIYEYLSPEERSNIEDKVLRKMVDFFTVEDSYSFDRVHNHGTWAVAGVGMTGMVLGDSTLIKKALYSTKLDGSGGFLKQIEMLFSPDGYYAEGPYYQRYALLPFIVFAQALDNNLPDLNIFEYKGGVLKKAVTTVLQMTAPDGRFLPINDAIKEKSWQTSELLFGTNIVYGLTGDKNLLGAAQMHGKVMLSIQGLQVAKDIHADQNHSFKRVPMLIHDGSKGDQGGLALMRLGKDEDQSTVAYKFSSQGMGHGHFDRLAIMVYDNGNEIMPDYGAARFLNVAAKAGGRYLPENTTWAKQTVAHNTVVINEASNFKGNVKAADLVSPELIFAQLEDDQIQSVSARDNECYEGVQLKRTITFMEVDGRRYMVDLFDVTTDEMSLVDFPLYYHGQVITTNFPYKKPGQLAALGSDQGYQHLWLEGEAKNLPETSTVTWMTGTGFYTFSFMAEAESNFCFTRLGADDPHYNLRHQGGMMVRHNNIGRKLYLSVLEMHGKYNPISEAVMQSDGSVEALGLKELQGILEINVDLKNKKSIRLALSEDGVEIK